jgi:hypothetical protein
MQQRKYLEHSIRWVGNRMSSAKDSGDREESGDYSRQNLRLIPLKTNSGNCATNCAADALFLSVCSLSLKPES